jgi:HEAT repeat protein
MATRLSLDDKLAAIRELREQPSAPHHTAELRRFLGDRSNLVVATAAALVAARTIVELAADLEAAYDRFLKNPLKDDKLCRAKIAVVTALDKLEHQEPEIFRRAATVVQFEPVWGGQVDTGAPLRGAAIFALARIGSSADLPLLVDSLADPEKEVRIASAQALASFGTEAAGLLLRLKANIGDDDPEVLSECLCGLLTINPPENLPFVRQFLDANQPARCEAAVLALGRSRLPEAFESLKSCLQDCHSLELRAQILLSMATMRLPAAIDYLMELVSSDSDDVAIAAMSALKIHNYDPQLRDRLKSIVERKGSRTVQATIDRDFSSDGQPP